MRVLALLCAIGTTLAMRTKCAQDKLSTVDDARKKGGWASMSIPDDCEEIILSRRFHLSDPPPPRPGRHGTPPGEKLDDAALTARVEAFARAIEDRDEDSALEVIRMDTNRLTGEHMMTIGAALATKPGRVHELQLMNNELDAKGGEGIALVLAANGSKIESLFLSRNPLGDEGMSAMCDAITARGGAEPYPLTRLTLDTNEVGDVGAAAFARMIGTGSTSLQSAHLVRNKIGDAGASSIADALRDERCLIEAINLKGNPVTDAGMLALGEALQNNLKLAFLDLTETPATDTADKAATLAGATVKDNAWAGPGARALAAAVAKRARDISAVPGGETDRDEVFEKYGLFPITVYGFPEGYFSRLVQEIDSEYVPPATAKPDIEIVEIDSPDAMPGGIMGAPAVEPIDTPFGGMRGGASDEL